MGILKRVAKAAYDEATKKKGFVKGDEFENYVRKYIFPESMYKVLERTHDSTVNKDFVESSLKPDFKFKSLKTNREFYVEAKFRSYVTDKGVEWCKDYQLKRYKDINKKTVVFIALGLGEKATNPEEIYVFPVKHAQYSELFWSILRKYKFQPKKAIDPQKLWSQL